MPEDLKPCPFCKQNDKARTYVLTIAFGKKHVKCGICDATGPALDTYDEAISAWNRRESPDTERLDWIIQMFNRPDVSTKLTGLQLGKILAGGLVRGVIYPNARAALDAARKGGI